MDVLSIGAMLRALGLTWFVDLTTAGDEWSLTVTKRVGGYSARTYTGSLRSVVERAFREAEPDSVSR